MRQIFFLFLCMLTVFGCAKDKNLSPVSQYDAELYKSVKKSWHDILGYMDQTRLKEGRVVVRFRLERDGRISDARIIENTTGPAEALAVERAVLNQANYKPWPDDMIQMVRSNYRWITITFNYK